MAIMLRPHNSALECWADDPQLCMLPPSDPSVWRIIDDRQLVQKMAVLGWVRKESVPVRAAVSGGQCSCPAIADLETHLKTLEETVRLFIKPKIPPAPPVWDDSKTYRKPGPWEVKDDD